MKFFIFSIAFILAAQLNADTQVFSGESQWNNSRTFEVMESSGIIFDAIEEAQKKCTKASGDHLCVVLSSHITAHNKWRYSEKHQRRQSFTKAIAIVKAVSRDSLKYKDSYETEKSVSMANSVTPLMSLGARHLSYSVAISLCYQAGNDVCILSESSLSYSNRKKFNENTGERRFATGAIAIVKGYLYK